jgi:hypothetical protein
MNESESDENRESYDTSPLLRLLSWSSMINLSAAVIGGRFFSLVPISTSPVTPEVGCLRGLAFRGFTIGLAFNGFIFIVGGALIVGAALGNLAEKERTTFSAPSSRLRPSSVGGVVEEPEGPASASARSICSAISMRSRCSSDVVARSFFRDAS